MAPVSPSRAAVEEPDPGLILQAASESIIVTTSDLDSPGPKIVFANPAFERMTGWAANEIMGKSPRILQGEKTDLTIFSTMRSALQTSQRWEGQTVNYRKDGSEFVMEWSITPLSDSSGRPKFYVAVQRDVTARIETERKMEQARLAAQEADRRKLNLQRYFSPKKVDILAERDRPLGQVRRESVAVIFVDIVGFTAIGENFPPERVVAFLRSFYRRMAAQIFLFDGSIEHFAGDAIMAVFGVPEKGPQDAANALNCVVRMREEITSWNEKRRNSGLRTIKVGISAHYGLAVLGDIGTKESMVFTVIGDTINAASRLQELCRSLDTDVLVSRELIEAASTENAKQPETIARFVDLGAHAIRGRNMSMRVHTLENCRSE